MNNDDFKIGDKVKLKNPKDFLHLGTKILTIVDVDCEDEYIPVWCEGMRGDYFPLKPCEMKKVNVKGQQLLFSFMEGS